VWGVFREGKQDVGGSKIKKLGKKLFRKRLRTRRVQTSDDAGLKEVKYCGGEYKVGLKRKIDVEGL